MESKALSSLGRRPARQPPGLYPDRAVPRPAPRRQRMALFVYRNPVLTGVRCDPDLNRRKYSRFLLTRQPIFRDACH